MTDTYPLSSGIDKLCYLYRAVHLLSARWTALSIQLSVRGLDQIQRNGRTSDICLALSLMEWLQSGEASWKGLVEAVFRPSGGGHQVLARDIANSYKSMLCVQHVESNPPCVFIQNAILCFYLETVAIIFPSSQRGCIRN